MAGQRETQGQHTGAPRHGRGEHTVDSARPAGVQPADATDEPLFGDQWHLSSSLGYDINVESVWADFTGAGVSVVVVDQGIQLTHPDLDANIDPINQIDSPNNDVGAGEGAPQTGDDNHGTAVAGVIAAEDNGIGVVGVAYEATLVSAYTPLIGAASEYAGLAFSGGFDISNNSWGWSPEFSNAFVDNFLLSGAPSGGDASFAQYGAVIEQTAEDGRDGLGTVHVFAAGNLGEFGDDVNLHNFQNSRHTIAVGATEEDGDVAVFSTPGAALLLSAPGVEIATTDRTGSAGYQTSSTAPLHSADYASVDGTSFAAPIVSGVTALMLEANSDLGVRDIQEIFAVSSRTIDPHESQWLTNGADWWNGGGLTWSHNYGSGLVDAHAAVRLAETWFAEDVFGTGTGTAATFNNEHSVTQSKSVNSSIPDNSAAGRSSTITIGEDFEIDQVEVHLRVSHTWVGDLTVSLTSPDGTTSMLVDRPLKSNFAPFGADSDHINFVFSSTFHWGEMSAGNWTLNVADRDASFTGTFQNWSLSLYGDNDSNDDTYLYTNEFGANFRHDNAARRTLSDGTGEDTINAAAIDRSGGEDSFINLNAGATSTIAGRALLIAAGTQIENAIAGDGDDIIIGNAAGNKLFGGRGSDRLAGLDGDDRIDGGDAGDVVNGGSGNDSLSGGNGNDIIYGLTGDDSIAGGAGNDRILGHSGNNHLDGGDDDDVIVGGSGNDSINGDSGIDIVNGLWGNDSIAGGTGRDKLTGHDGDDFIDGGDDGDVINGGSGNDSLSGGNGNDLILGYDDDDSIAGGTGSDRLAGLDGDDRIDGGDAGDVVNGGSGNDSLSGGNGNDIIYGLTGDDRIAGGAGNDRILGHSGNNHLDGGDDDDVIVGGSGNDSINGDGGADVINGLWGNDSIAGGAGEDRLMGHDGDDFIDGGDDGDVIDGGRGDDELTGGAGRDIHVFNSGDGNDQITDFEVDEDRLNLLAISDISDFSDLMANHASDDGVGNVLISYGSDSIRLLGVTTGDLTEANFFAVHETLTGGPGNDTIDGRDGNDLIDGLGGDDTLYGGRGSDTLRGGDGNDRLDGGAGNDIFDGGSGSDIFVVSGGGDDTVSGFTIGTDKLDIGPAGEIISFVDLIANHAANDGLGNVLLDLDGGSALLVGVEIADLSAGDFLQDGDPIPAVSPPNTITGTTGDDTLSGDVLGDVILGLGGNDILAGNGGDDTIQGGADDDVLAGGPGNDTLDGGSGDDALLGRDGDDVLLGQAGEDLLNGGTGHDLLRGGEGNDYLLGGAGNDTLSGGADGDIFVLGDGNDTITDFTAGTDKIDITSIPGIKGFSDFIADFASDDGNGNMTLDLGAHSTHLTAVEIADLSHNDFLYHGAPLSEDSLFDSTVSGTSASETLTGTADADLIEGLAGADLLQGLAGDELLAGGADDDRHYGSQGNDTVQGGTGNDMLSGGAGDDLLSGGDGDDRLRIGLGADSLSGGEGNDTFEVDILVTNGVNSLDGGAGFDTLHIDGTNGGGTVTIAGTTITSPGTTITTQGLEQIVFDGGDGNGTIVDDVVDATASDFAVTLVGGRGSNILSGGSGNDSITTHGDGNSLSGGGGDDYLALINRYGRDNYLSGGNGNDTLIGGSNGDTMLGGAGDDTIISGGGANDEISGGSGDDVLVIGASRSTMSGGEGSDVFALYRDQSSSLVDATITDFNAGVDVLNVGGARDITSFADFFAGHAANDGNGNLVITFNPGTFGLDTVTLPGVSREDLGAGNLDFSLLDALPIAFGTAGDDVLAGGEGANTLHGLDGDDTLLGNSGDDSLVGGNDDDLLNGGAGQDRLDGGSNNDTVIGGAGDDFLIGNNGDDTLDGGAGNDILRAGGHSDTLLGGEGDDHLFGLGANDTLIGGNGNDTLAGGNGDDVMTGGAGNDLFAIGANDGDDTITDFTPGTDVLDLGMVSEITSFADLIASHAVNDGSGNLTITYGANTVFLQGVAIGDLSASDISTIPLADVTISGSNTRETLIGGQGDDRISGGGGNVGGDNLFGGGGDDTIFGGGTGQFYISAGNTIHGEDGNDYLSGAGGNDSLFGGNGDDVIWSSGGDNLVYGGSGVDTVTSSRGHDTIFGGDGDDFLSSVDGHDSMSGGAGDDSIFSGSNNDMVSGGAGDDVLEGGNHDDVFIFGDGDGDDVIVDFGYGSDRLDLRGVSAIGDFADLTNNHITTDASGNVLIEHDVGSILLIGVSTGDLNSGDFIF